MRLTKGTLAAATSAWIAIVAWAQEPTVTTRPATEQAEPPTLTLAPPLDSDLKAKESKLTIRGRTAPGATVTLRLNGVNYEVKAGADGEFVIREAPLGLGPNELRLTATDAAGNVTVLDRQILRPAQPGDLFLVAPLDKMRSRVANAVLEVSGFATPGARLNLQVEGACGALVEGQADAAGVFRLTAPLDEGSCLVKLYAGERGAAALRRLEVDLRGPDVQVVAPGPVRFVEHPDFALTGRTEPGATITLSGKGPELKVQADERGFFMLAPVRIVDGENQFTLALADDLGNTRRLPVTVHGRVSHPALTVISPGEGWLPTRPRFVVEHEAGATLNATLNGQPVALGESKAVDGGGVLGLTRTELVVPPLEPGGYELMVSAVSASGVRRSAVIRRFHLPGPPRQALGELQPAVVAPGATTTLAVAVLDAGRQPVLDDTPVTVRVPDGWLVGGQPPPGADVRVGTRQGLAELRLTAGPHARPGLVLVTAGKVTESLKLGIATPR